MNKFEPIYMHQFSDKQDIADNFSINLSDLEECDILLAYYHCGSWGCDSSAFVLYEYQGVLYENHGSHCSCHGLEGQWDPDETNVESLEHRTVHGSLGSVGGYDSDGYVDEGRRVIAYLKERANEPA